MKKILVLMAVLILVIVSSGITVTADTELYNGDDSPEDVALFYQLDLGHAVKFTPPTTPWTLEKVEVAGGYVNESGDIIFALEIWDKDYNLLYKLTDYSPAYFDIFRWTEIDIPDLAVNGDFYVCFFTRGSVYVGLDTDNPAKRSYMVLRFPPGLEDVTYQESEGSPEVPFNWMIKAIGS
jgi:hypothetical protein